MDLGDICLPSKKQETIAEVSLELEAQMWALTNAAFAFTNASKD